MSVIESVELISLKTVRIRTFELHSNSKAVAIFYLVYVFLLWNLSGKNTWHEFRLPQGACGRYLVSVPNPGTEKVSLLHSPYYDSGSVKDWSSGYPVLDNEGIEHTKLFQKIVCDISMEV